jgi:hypothetical protein
LVYPLLISGSTWIGGTEHRMKSKLYPLGIALALLVSIMAAGIFMVPK